MFERFTDKARTSLAVAQEEARALRHNFLGTEHLLLGLIHQEDGVAAQVLINLGLKLEAIRNEVIDLIGSRPELSNALEEVLSGREGEEPSADVMLWLLGRLIDELKLLKYQRVLDADYESAAEAHEILNQAGDVLNRLRTLMKRD